MAYLIIITKDNVVEDCYEIENKESAQQSFLEECQVIDDNFHSLDHQFILEESYHTYGVYGVTLWTLYE